MDDMLGSELVRGRVGYSPPGRADAAEADFDQPVSEQIPAGLDAVGAQVALAGVAGLKIDVKDAHGYTLIFFAMSRACRLSTPR